MFIKHQLSIALDVPCPQSRPPDVGRLYPYRRPTSGGLTLAIEKEYCYYADMLDKKKIKEKLEKERDNLLEQMKGMGKLNTETDEWETTPEEQDFPESDENDKADRFEDFEARSSVMKTLEPRLNSILKALKGLNRESFGKCVVCKKDIEMARLEVNPAAQTCKKHLES
ncbi:MAG: TraR/DksA C4-type zinc finger protein [Candidatus Pacebacteria bacterium]|nr:TraR/DksA C4-type zinc finger protein [Candidatus Paceibacterota bacterium]